MQNTLLYYSFQLVVFTFLHLYFGGSKQIKNKLKIKYNLCIGTCLFKYILK